MNDKVQAIELVMIEIDDVALILRSIGMDDVADRLDDARDILKSRSVAMRYGSGSVSDRTAFDELTH